MQKQYKEKPYTAPRSWYNNTSSLLNIIAVLAVLNIFFWVSVMTLTNILLILILLALIGVGFMIYALGKVLLEERK